MKTSRGAQNTADYFSIGGKFEYVVDKVVVSPAIIKSILNDDVSCLLQTEFS